ncbi:uncharacterized protein K02A2.6-like [Galendromus occidentalis]|uniref:RNA-directed DNA polymerase n=1 Tax=Galendromus occidentalis TaxID=34638 RepID=A0AAJ7L6L3_9ACAR|nr:uncharacterized protein K02A2.6-like [Galendromus occidentalis]
MAIQDYDSEVLHRRGQDNGNADALSRLSVATLSVERARQEQRHDPVCRNLLRSPPEGYTVRDQLLYREGRLYIPAVLVTDTIKLCHEDGMSGHPGVWKTGRRLNERFDVGKGGLAKVRNHVKSCDICQHQKAGPVKVGTLQPIAPPTRPSEEVGSDFAEPFNLPGERAWYVLVVVDYCTRYIHLFATRRISARFVVRSLSALTAVTGRIGSVVTDNATCFRGIIYANYLQTAGTVHIRAALGHPQCNGLV